MIQNYPSQFLSTKRKTKQKHPMNTHWNYNPLQSYNNPVSNQFCMLDLSSYDEPKVTQSDGNRFGLAGNIVGGASVIDGLVGFDAALNSTRSLKYAQRINGSVVSAAELTALRQAKALKVLNASKSLGKKLGIAGSVVILADVLYNSEIKASHGVNTFMTAIAFTGLGAPVAGIWFVADFGTGLITGTSISDRIDANTGSLDWDW